MKKNEAIKIAPKRAELLCEYITQILSDPDKVDGEIEISYAKIENKNMITYDIYVPSKNFEKHLNTGITTEQIDILTEQILNYLIDTFLESETMGCTRYYSIRGGMGMNMDGVDACNSIGSRIKINFVCRGEHFRELMSEYNLKIDEYINKQSKRSL